MSALPSIRVRPYQAKAARSYFLKHPEEFVRRVLGTEPTTYQVEIIRSVFEHTHTSVRSCHGAGKSGVSGLMVVPAFLLLHPDSLVITTAPTQRQVEGIIWREIRRANQRAKVPLGGKVDLTKWKLRDGWMAMGFTAPPKDPDKFQGWHASSADMLVVVDEAAGVAQTIYDEGIQSIISTGKARLLLIGNPTSSSGEFYNSHKPSSNYHQIKISAFDTPNFTEFGITMDDIRNDTWEPKLRGTRQDKLPRPYLVSPHWVAQVYKQWGESSPRFQARVLAEFAQLGKNSLSELAWVERAYENSFAGKGDPILICDVAGEGEDFTTIGLLYPSGKYRRLARENGLLTTQISTTIRALAPKYAGDDSAIVIDANGIGAGVADQLIAMPAYTREGMAIPVHKFIASKAPKNPHLFKNKRAEALWATRYRCEHGLLDLDRAECDLLEEELSQLSWEQESGTEKIVFMKKDEFKTQFGRSTDDLDTLSMGCDFLTQGKIAAA